MIEPPKVLLNLYGSKTNGIVKIQDNKAVLFPQYFLNTLLVVSNSFSLSSPATSIFQVSCFCS